jgi:hypothetical protein
MTTRRHPLPLLLIAFALVAGCGGPTKPVDVGVVKFGTDVQFGAEKVTVLPPVPPGAQTLAPPAIGVPIVTGPPILGGPTPTPAKEDCPPPDPFAISLDAPTTTIAKPPREATYVFRNEGTYAASGAVPVSVPYPTTSTRQVRNVVVGVAGFTFDVVNTLGTVRATTSYSYVPPTQPLVSGSTPSSGLYVTRVQQISGQKLVSDFTADGAGLLLLQVPAIAGTRWFTAATDLASGAVISMGVEVGKTTRVNACGRAITVPVIHVDGTIGLKESVISNPVDVTVPVPSPSGASSIDLVDGSSTTFTGDYGIATQYGGIAVMDSIEQQGTADGAGILSKNTATINSVPASP